MTAAELARTSLAIADRAQRRLACREAYPTTRAKRASALGVAAYNRRAYMEHGTRANLAAAVTLLGLLRAKDRGVALPR